MYARRSANADCTALRVWNAKPATFLFGSVPLGPNFTETRSSPAEILIALEGIVDRATSLLLEVFRQWNFVEDLMFFVEINRKRKIWVSAPHFGEVRGDARPWLTAHGRLSIRVNWTFFDICYSSEVMRRWCWPE